MGGARFELYRSVVQKSTSLQAEDVNSLAWRAWLGDDESRQHLIERHLWMAVEMAERLRAGNSAAQSRLIADGNRALVRAARSYRPWQDGEFTAYAHDVFLRELTREELPTA